jgi:hypothetical protein
MPRWRRYWAVEVESVGVVVVVGESAGVLLFCNHSACRSLYCYCSESSLSKNFGPRERGHFLWGPRWGRTAGCK